MKTFIFLLITFIFYIATFTSCTKPSTNTPVGVDTISNLNFSNSWQCMIDGVSYSGTVDTSFMEVVYYTSFDSIIVCTGTSANGKAHIHFKVSMNRTKFPAIGVDNGSNSYLVFDTAASNLFVGNLSLSTPALINYALDTISGKNLVISYSGELRDQHLVHHTINGKFSCRLNTGNNDPSKYYFLLDSVRRWGYFTSAMVNANTLVMEGVDYMDFPFNPFRLIIRTGGTIKPGIYRNNSGDVSFKGIQLAGGITGNFYVDDSIGDLTVSIESVNGNIIKGNFFGLNALGYKIEGGTFICRVANYAPENDAVNRWAFGAWIDPAFGVYNSYAGNVTSAAKTTASGRNYLSIAGESDNGMSRFKITLSSSYLLTTGIYQLHNSTSNVIDTIYFKSGIPAWDGIVPHLFVDASVASRGGETYCSIDTLDNNHVVGSFYGTIFDNLEDNLNGSGPREIHKASFRAVF
jgi:hypothetical protein